MLSCESCQSLIADALYDPLGDTDSQKLQQHVQGCTECARVMHEMQSAKTALESQGISSDIYDDIPERAGLDDLFQRLQADLDRIDAERYRQSQTRRRVFTSWGPALAIAASVVLFFSVVLVGLNQPETSPEIATTPAPAPGNQADQEFLQYLSRAQTMLMMVANADSQNAASVPLRQSFARNMAEEANFLTTAGEDTYSSGQSRLLRDIEFLLWQVANLDESNMEEGVALLQRFIEDNSILFRIRLVEMREQETVI